MVNDTRTLQERLAGAKLEPLEEKIRNCGSAAEIQELMLLSNQYTGGFRRESDGSVTYQNRDFGTQLPTIRPVETPQSKPQDDGMLREVWQSPNGNLRVVDAFSPSGLDALTKHMRFEGWKRVR